jgi:cystathionine beta-lyase/cystathionine gamma-synthase
VPELLEVETYRRQAERAELGISDGLVRISVGLEHVDDLIADLDQALARAEAAGAG